MDERIGVGVVGAGVIFQKPAEAYAQLGDRVRLAAVAEVDEVKLQQTLARHSVPFGCRDYRHLLEREDVDIVTVCTPPCFHEQIVIDALEAGKYVICEKPLAHTLEAADRIRIVADRHPGKLSTTFQFRYLPEVQRTVWLRDHERLGRLLFGRFSWYGRFQKPGRPRMEWWGRWQVAGGGAVMTQLIHEIDLMCHIFGPATEVSAVVDTLKEPIESEDTCVATVRFGSGAIACCYSTMSAQRFGQGFDVFGTLASVHHPWALECMDEGWRRAALDDVLAVYPLALHQAAQPHAPHVAAGPRRTFDPAPPLRRRVPRRHRGGEAVADRTGRGRSHVGGVRGDLRGRTAGPAGLPAHGQNEPLLPGHRGQRLREAQGGTAGGRLRGCDG